MRDSELTVRGPAAVGGLLGVPADGDGGIAEVADLDLVPGQRLGVQHAGLVALQPLGFVEDEAERSYQPEFVDCQLCENDATTSRCWSNSW